MPIVKQFKIGLLALATITCAMGSHIPALAAHADPMTDANAAQIPSEAELNCIYEAAGLDALMNFAEAATESADEAALRERIALEMADCAQQYGWDSETQTLAYGTFFYSALLEYNIEGTGSPQFDGSVIFDIWGELSDDDKAGLVAKDARNNAELLARVTAVIRSKVPNATDQGITHTLNALAAATLYADLRHQWSQKAAGK